MKKTMDTATINEQPTDEQLVDYLLKVLTDSEQRQLAQRINQDAELQQRLNTWQNALFSFHDDTEAKTPPQRVWQGIEQQLFDDARPPLPKGRFWGLANGLTGFLTRGFLTRGLAPALLAFCVLLGVTFWLQNGGYRPSPQAQYHASVSGLRLPITLWEVEGDRDSIAFTSIRDVSQKGRECVAWLKQGRSAPIRLGPVPDTGDKMAYRIALPNNLTAKVGDRIIIAMVDRGDLRLPPVAEQHITELTDI